MTRPSPTRATPAEGADPAGRAAPTQRPTRPTRPRRPGWPGLTGTGGLLRMVLRRDRVLLPVWLLGLAIMPAVYASSVRRVYPTAAARQRYYDSYAGNATFVVRNGPLHGASLGELVAWQCGFIPVAVGLLSLLTVIRHTRVEEEAGRRELTGATVVGRHAGLAAALLLAAGGSLLLGLLTGAGLTARGLPVAGSFALGAGFALTGWVFAAVGAVAAQLTWGAGAARGLAIGALVLAFGLRAIGDSSDRTGGSAGWLAWLSPIGWAHRLRPYAGERWWVLGLAAGLTAALAMAAAGLAARRDLGAGLLPARLGPGTAPATLRSPLGLAWRLHRGPLAVWVGCLALIGLIMGGVAQSTADLVNDNPSARDVIARLGGSGALLDAYLAGTMTLFGLIAAGYAIAAALKLHAEEAGGRAEPVLATAVGRLRWAASHIGLALAGSAAVLAAAGLATGLAYGGDRAGGGGGAGGSGSGGAGHQAVRLLGAALAQLPAVWVLAALAVALIGLLPRLATAAWAALAAVGLLSLLGAALRWSPRLLDISPFAHVPPLPGGPFSIAPLAALTLVAAAVVAVGLAGLRRRDLPAA